MKHLLFLLFTLSLTLGFTQNKLAPKITKTSTVYILDETWQPREAPHWETDGDLNYVQIVSEEYFVLSSRTRGKFEYYEGEIESWTETDSKIHFWVRGRAGSGATIAFDIVFLEGDKIEMHMYNTLGRYDKYYGAHVASKEEMKALLDHHNKANGKKKN